MCLGTAVISCSKAYHRASGKLTMCNEVSGLLLESSEGISELVTAE